MLQFNLYTSTYEIVPRYDSYNFIDFSHNTAYINIPQIIYIWLYQISTFLGDFFLLLFNQFYVSNKHYNWRKKKNE